ncbi:Translation initiation factor IF-2, partial [isoform beta'] [Buchnera aphidicola (Phyllaphis fagi)]
MLHLKKKFLNILTKNYKFELNKNIYHEMKKYKYYKKNTKYYGHRREKEEKKIIFHPKRKMKNHIKNSALRQNFKKPNKLVNKDIVINETMTIFELSNKMSKKSSEVIQKMIQLGVETTSDNIIDQETAQLIAEEMGHKVLLKHENELETSVMNARNIVNSKCIKKNRPPVVTIMGHVDHGKTTLLDYIRSSNVAMSEYGGITQHIGAYNVKIKSGTITFLDTPGHAAFTSMRARGAQITDIVVLVVAGDDGVKPQTIEAICHAQAANVPILVVINKIDKSQSNPEIVKKELMKYNILPEEWGGQNIFVNVSAKTGVGINNLLDAILLQAELLELTAMYSGMASGVVIESCLDKSRGSIATVLVQEGILKKGDVVLCGLEYGKIRAIRDAFGCELQSSGPSIPVQILGLSGIPISGDIFTVVKNEKQARAISIYKKTKCKEMKFSNIKKINLENMFENLNNKKKTTLNIILKSDVQGSLEAIVNAIHQIKHENIAIKIISSSVGNITETDISLSLASQAIIIAFNVQSNVLAKRMIEIEKIDVRYYSVIYNLIDDLNLSMIGLLSPKYKKEMFGSAEIRNIFKAPKSVVIAGCMVIHGIIKRHNHIHLVRNNRVVYKGELESLRRFKQDAKEVQSGKECGISIKNYNDMHVGDIIESFETIELKQ